MSSRRGPTYPSRPAKTLTKGAFPGGVFCDALANRQLPLENKLDLERIAEIRDLWLSGC
jgi:hypothetical protein